MKKKCDSITNKGALTLKIDPSDSLAWKLSMLIEASLTTDQTIEQISSKYGYQREYFYKIRDKFLTNGSEGLRDKITGPKTNYVRTKDVTKAIISHCFLDPEASCEVITQKLKQEGHKIGLRSVQRVVREYGLQKKGSTGKISKKKTNPKML